MKVVKFDRAWEKLRNRKEGDIITTFRRFTPQKRKYYTESLGHLFNVEITFDEKGFAGFNDDELYLKLTMQVISILFGGEVERLKLLDIDLKFGKDITEDMKKYDTEFKKGEVRE